MAQGSPFRWGTYGQIGGLALVFFLILFGVIGLLGAAIPAWVLYVTAIIAGVLLLIGR